MVSHESTPDTATGLTYRARQRAGANELLLLAILATVVMLFAGFIAAAVRHNTAKD